MHKFLTTIFALVLAAGIPAAAFAQGGYYTWSVSASDVDPFVNSAAVPPAGLFTLYLWFVEGCATAETGGMAAAEFKVNKPAAWTFVGSNVQNGFLDAGPGPGAGKNFLLAVGSCPVGPVVASHLVFFVPGTGGRVGFTVTDNVSGLSNLNGTVDCAPNPALHLWPEFVRCAGFATSDALPFQNHGSGCTVTSVEEESWGKVKGLYR